MKQIEKVDCMIQQTKQTQIHLLVLLRNRKYLLEEVPR